MILLLLFEIFLGLLFIAIPFSLFVVLFIHPIYKKHERKRNAEISAWQAEQARKRIESRNKKNNKPYFFIG